MQNNDAFEKAPVDWFLNVAEIVSAKDIKSLVELWDELFPKQAAKWTKYRNCPQSLEVQFKKIVEKCKLAVHDTKKEAELDKLLEETDNLVLYGIVRAIHFRVHLRELDKEVETVEMPKKKALEDILDHKLILQSYLDYLRNNGPDKFAEFVNSTVLRLVSTVHPNETERNTNLMHYTSLLDKYFEWKKGYQSINALPTRSSEYRIRREQLNQLRRAIKAEIEGLWQSDQMRKDPIPVQSEARRILERYKVIVKAYPTFLKFVKFLAREAFWLYQASLYVQSEKWRQTFIKFYNQGTHINARQDKLKAIRKTFASLDIKLTPPRILQPVITFGTWKGGDRDGNPFVVASFTNQTFVDQKEFILERYLEFAKELIDKLTPALSHTSVSEKLTQSIKKDAKDFPYISNIKPQEPYRAKLRYIIEKLENTLQRVREVKKRAGETIHPLLGQTLVGPSGYNLSHELQQDIDTMYASLLEHEGKAQARSLVQDFKILVDTFGFHLCSIDFRQTSDKNFAAVKEYLAAIGHNAAENLSKFSESDKQKLLLSLITADQIELDPWVIPQLSKISRDTIETMLIFADAARTDSRAVGKFIISMCQSASDILIILFLFKLVGMLECQSNTISFCPFDVCGLFETIEDLKSAPRIVEQLFAIPMFRDYIVKLRGGKFTVMLGYSDSVKDGSALASDAEIARVSFALKILEDELNAKYDPIQRIQFIFYRGRGDTIPRGYGGSITKAICSQLVTQRAEDHTEQNRYLRKYASVTSAVDHLHSVYSAHVTAQVREISPLTSVYQNFFEFFGTISFLHWNTLVRGSRGKTYFNILKKFSILPHLHKSHFASRPITREGTDYDIETIRAIPFVMTLSQLREFTSAYYGTGTAFEEGQRLLDDHYGTALQLLRAHLSMIGENAQVVESFQQQLLAGDFAAGNESLGQLIRLMFPDKLSSKQAIEDFFTEVKKMEKNKFLASILERYHGPDASNQIAFLIVYLKEQNFSVLELLRKMYREYPPFRYSIENKETALLIRNKRIVDCYTNEISDEERQVLDDTEREAQLTKKWILNINQQKELESKTLTQDFNSAELFLLHKIQSKYMSLFRQLTSKKQHLLKYKTEQGDAEAKSLNAQLELLSIFIQMTILAISEALGFGG